MEQNRKIYKETTATPKMKSAIPAIPFPRIGVPDPYINILSKKLESIEVNPAIILAANKKRALDKWLVIRFVTKVKSSV